MFKTCSKCRIEKKLSDFSKDRMAKSGIHSACKSCHRLYRTKRKQEISKYQKNYYKSHKEVIKQYNVIYRDSNKKLIQEQSKKYKESHNKEILFKSKIYRESHKKQQNKYHRNRRLIDPTYKLVTNLRTRIYLALKNDYKSKTSKQLLGCTIAYLKQHLASQFTKGMDWDNYGKWHVDHIKPCALFDLSKPSEQLKCFHYTNLQPLWADDNLKKGIKIIV